MEGPARLRFPYILFDLGSTLIYFDGDWPTAMAAGLKESTRYLRSLGYALDEETFPAAHHALIEAYYRKGEDALIQYTSQYVLRKAIAQALRAGRRQRVPAGHLREALRALYGVTQQYWHVEPDAAATLQLLRAKGCRLGIISNAPDDDDVRALVENAQLKEFFDFVLTSAKAKVRKPAPSIFEAALAHWGARSDQAVMVGDTVTADVAGANRLGIASVWICRRADTPENHAAAKMHRPDATVQALSELPLLLEGWPANGQPDNAEPR